MGCGLPGPDLEGISYKAGFLCFCSFLKNKVLIKTRCNKTPAVYNSTYL